MAGWKTKQESRADELRRRLAAWREIPESQRPSLRALARELGTSHQMLGHCLSGLGKWQANEYWRRAKEISSVAHAAGRPMTAWEEQQSRALDRRAICLFLESSFDDSAKNYEREIERCIKDGKMPARGYPKLLRTIASVRGGPAAQRAAQRAQMVLQKYFSPEGQKIVRERLRMAAKPDKATLQARRARHRQIRLQKLVERFEEIGGAVLPDRGRVCYFIPEESAMSRVLVTELTKYREDLKQIVELNPGKVDFDRIKAEICQRFPAVPLSPLDSH